MWLSLTCVLIDHGVENLIQMVCVGIPHVCPYDFIAAFTFEAALYVGGAETPQCFAGDDAKQKIIAASCVLGAFRLSRRHIVRVLIGETTTNHHTVDLCEQLTDRQINKSVIDGIHL